MQTRTDRRTGRDHGRGVRLRQCRSHAAHISAPFRGQSARLPGAVSINPAQLNSKNRVCGSAPPGQGARRQFCAFPFAVTSPSARENTGSGSCRPAENIGRKPMRILFLTSAHNSLSQRLWIALGERGHEIRVCVAATDAAMIAAVSCEAPDLIIAPMLKIAIPEEVWSRHLCLIVHPGIKGDRGPSSLDWVIANDEKIWGVTILEAADAFDAGPIWASHEFALEADPPAKSSLYRRQVTEA